MSLRPEPLSALVVPDETVVEEHDIVLETDVIVAAQSTVDLGIRGRNVIAGERARFGGDIEASGDCRLDMWCTVAGNVLVGGDAYLGERTEVGGQLVVAGDLDIGDDVTIEEGFEANGWIVIRNPTSTFVLLYVYLTHLLSLGADDAANELVSEVFEDAGDTDPLVIPENATVTDEAWRVSTPARIGADCRVHGNVRAAEIAVGGRTELFGSLRARERIEIGAETTIHGDVSTRGGEVRVAPDVLIRGDIACEELSFHESAVVEGTIRARGEMSIERESTDLTDSENETVDAGTESEPDDSDTATNGEKRDDTSESTPEADSELADVPEADGSSGDRPLDVNGSKPGFDSEE